MRLPACVSAACSIKYQPVQAWACDATVAEGQSRCPKHWCSRFFLYAQDGQPCQMANSTQQLAALLQLSDVRVCGAVSKQPVQLPDGFQAPPHQRQDSPMQQDPPAQQGSPTQQQDQQQQQLRLLAVPASKPRLTLTVPKVSGTAVRRPCCAVMVMLEVSSGADFVPGPTFKVPYSWCCGREAAPKDFCKQHTTARYVIVDKCVGGQSRTGSVLCFCAGVAAAWHIQALFAQLSHPAAALSWYRAMHLNWLDSNRAAAPHRWLLTNPTLHDCCLLCHLVTLQEPVCAGNLQHPALVGSKPGLLSR